MVNVASQLHKIIKMIDDPLFAGVSDPLQECPKNARRVPFLGVTKQMIVNFFQRGGKVEILLLKMTFFESYLK